MDCLKQQASRQLHPQSEKNFITLLPARDLLSGKSEFGNQHRYRKETN